MSRITVNFIVNRLDEGPPELTKGANIPSGEIIRSSGNVNVGVATIGIVSTTNISASTITASRFVGDGSQLTGLPIVSPSKIIALNIILSDPPLRS